MSSVVGSAIGRNASIPTCALPGCSKQAWLDPSGAYSAFCGRSHRDAMARGASTPTASGQICKQCGTKPAYVEPNGHVHDFCGRRCRDASANQPVGGNVLPLCKHCGTKSVFVESNGHEHDYCGRRCRDAALQGGASGPSNAISAGATLCEIPGCGRAAFARSRWCSDQHRREAVRSRMVEACLLCQDMPKVSVNGKETDFCSKACAEDSVRAAPIIFEVPDHHKAYENVSTQFTNAWKHPTPVPSVHKIWKIYGKKNLNDAYSAYRDAIARTRGPSYVNVRRRFHGTARACKLGDDLRNKDLCNGQDCSLCSIICSSFQLACVGQNTNFGRFGAGIYTSGTSSKANDYVKNLGGSSTRAMLLNQVVMGQAVKLTQDDPSLTEPPNGADSVIGEPGGVLNYDEAIVYNNDAIRPTFLIIYQ